MATGRNRACNSGRMEVFVYDFIARMVDLYSVSRSRKGLIRMSLCL